MKILIVSDTHRKDDNLKQVIEMTKPLDMLIHLGDAEGSEYQITDWVNEGCRLEMVMGNNDFFTELDQEMEIEIGNYRALLTHGHYYNVSLGVEGLRRETKERGCNMVMYGHTHRPYLEETEDLIILNPGSLSYPRQDGRKCSYMIMELDESGKAHIEITYL